MRMTLKTSLALRVLMVCAAQPDRLVRKHEIARACNASEAHLALVIHQLGQAGFIRTHRGRSGGIELAAAPERLRLGPVVRRFEEGHAMTECFNQSRNTCPMIDVCTLKPILCKALAAFYAVLDGATLAELLVDDGGGLREVLEIP